MPFDKNIKIPNENEYLNCIRCGLCLAVCPTYREYKNETDSPRGRVALARKSLEDELILSPNLVEQLQNILLSVSSWACTSSPIMVSYSMEIPQVMDYKKNV